MPTHPVLSAALSYAARGWPVLPVIAKRPLIKNWPHEATTSPEIIKRWWKQWPGANAGIVTGKRSGIVVVDVDPRHGGRWEPNVSTLTALSGGRGYHYIFRFDPRIVNRDIAPGTSVLSTGRFFVVAPSIHPSGGSYKWVNSAAPAPPPACLLSKTPKTPIPTGARNTTLTSIAGKLHFHGSTRLEAELQEINRTSCNPPLPEGEVASIARSIGNKPRRGAPLKQAFARRRAWIRKYSQFILSTSWPGLAGATDRTVITALARIAFAAGNRKLSVSERQLAEAAAIGRPAVRHALKRLETAGWLRRCSRGYGLKASEFELTAPRLGQEDTINPSGNNLALMVSGCPPDADAFRWRGLGKNALQLQRFLTVASWRDTESLAQAAHISRRTVDRNLRRLESVGLVSRTPGGWWRAAPAECMFELLRKAAQRLGTAGAGRRQREMHRAERLAYRRLMARRGEARRRRLKITEIPPSRWDQGSSVRAEMPSAMPGAP